MGGIHKRKPDNFGPAVKKFLGCPVLSFLKWTLMGIHIVRCASKDFLSASNGSDVWTEFEVIVGMDIII